MNSTAPSCINTADTTWVLISTVLVLGMMPALAFFEAGLLRSKNTLSLTTQIFSGIITLSVMWVVFGYTLTFGKSWRGIIGNFDNVLMIGVNYFECSEHAPTIPAACFATFQMMFAAIAPLLMTGAFAERMHWKHFYLFTFFWELLVYYPVAHWIWGNGFLGNWGVLDFAGGIVIHTTAGASSVVCALIIGRRKHFESYFGEFPPSNVPLASIGAALLWMGWFGFNGGSALQAGSVAVSAVVSTQIGCSVSAFVWMVLSWYYSKPSTTALMNGALAGLAGITPASGYINTQYTILLGFIFGAASFYAVRFSKHKLQLDDALDVSIVHGLTGVIGSIGVGFFASEDHSGIANANGLFYGNKNQLLYQFVGVIVAIVYSSIITAIILKILNKVCGDIRLTEAEEEIGCDWTDHREIAYHKLHVLSSKDKYHYTQHIQQHKQTDQHPEMVYDQLDNKDEDQLPWSETYKRSYNHLLSSVKEEVSSPRRSSDTSSRHHRSPHVAQQSSSSLSFSSSSSSSSSSVSKLPISVNQPSI